MGKTIISAVDFCFTNGESCSGVLYTPEHKLWYPNEPARDEGPIAWFIDDPEVVLTVSFVDNRGEKTISIWNRVIDDEQHYDIFRLDEAFRGEDGNKQLLNNSQFVDFLRSVDQTMSVAFMATFIALIRPPI